MTVPGAAGQRGCLPAFLTSKKPLPGLAAGAVGRWERLPGLPLPGAAAGAVGQSLQVVGQSLQVVGQVQPPPLAATAMSAGGPIVPQGAVRARDRLFCA